MGFVILIICLSICLYGGYRAGYEYDIQLADPKAKMRVVKISPKWKKLFRFRYFIPNEALLIGVIAEIEALICSVAMIVGYILQCIFAPDFVWVPLIILAIDGVLAFCISLVATVQFYFNLWRSRKVT